MRAILYDFTDQERGWTLRLIEDGRMVMQAHLLGDVGRRIANRIVESFAAPMELIGPKGRESSVGSPLPDRTIDPAAGYKVTTKPAPADPVPAKKSNQLALFGD